MIEITDEIVDVALKEWSKPNDTREPRDIMREALTKSCTMVRVGVRPLDLSNLLKHAFTSGYMAAAGDYGWTDYDPTTCAAYGRIIAAVDLDHKVDM